MEMKRSDMGNMGERGGDGMMPPGGGGMPGGGGIPGGGGSMPGEGMGGPPGGMEKPKGMEKQEIWMKILLATGKSSAEDIAEVE